MPSKDQIAHDLAMVYMKNRYGIDVVGNFIVNDGVGSGMVETKHFPSTSEPLYVKTGTGEKGFLGIERKEKVRSGNRVDSLFDEMVESYCEAYSYFYDLLSSKELS